jgi:hypothetical protein
MQVGVHNATIPHTWYNIFGRNWMIYLGYGGVQSISGSIPDQNYTAYTLATAFQTSVNNAMLAAGLGATFIVSYNADTNFYTFSNSVVALTAPWYFMQVQDSCYLELGLRLLANNRVAQASSSLNSNGTAYVLTPAAMVDLSAFHGVYINFISQVSNAQASYNGLSQTSILARVPVRQPFGAIETYEPDNITYVYLPNASLTDVHITLTGDDGQPLDLHGVNWTMTLHIKFGAIRLPDVSTERMLPAGSLMETQLYGGRRVY